MAALKIFRWKKRRKYPVKVDEEGRSARSRCFEMFPQEIPLREITRETGVRVDTVRRYHLQWKKDPGFEKLYSYTKSLFDKNTPSRDGNIELFARAWGIDKERLEAILSQPRGLQRLLSGKFYFPVQAEVDNKRRMALDLALLIFDHLTKRGGKFEDVYFALKRYLRERKQYREDIDRDIAEDNKFMKLVRALLAADIENEKKGRVKPVTLSREEQDTLMRWGIEAEMKKLEKFYWYRIGALMTEGLSPEEAREKMYKNLLEKGNLKGAEALRKFQDKHHPLKTNDREPPSAPPQPPPAT
jgi:hypothetical protein